VKFYLFDRLVFCVASPNGVSKLMKNILEKTQSIFSLVLISCIFLGNLPLPCYSQDKPIVISFGQPNIWSLEQAHYLLARMHRQNLDLKTNELGDLNPNEVNTNRINVVKTLLEAGFKYDEAVRINNNLLKSDKQFNSQRRQQLTNQRSTLQADALRLTSEISTLKIAKAKSTDEEEKQALEAQIEAKTEEKALINEQLTQVNGELSGLSSATGDFQSSSASGDAFKYEDFPKSVLDTLIEKKTDEFTTKPSIAASQRLENHIQMQYEIIAKQLTLLRDEVGPGERLVFLELPQSVNTSQGRAENKIAQVWWRISGYTKADANRLFINSVISLKKSIEERKTILNEASKSKSELTNTIEGRKKLEELENAKETKHEKLQTLTDRLTDLKSKLAKNCNEKQTIGSKEVEKRCSEKLSTSETKNLESSLRAIESSIIETERAIQIIKDKEVKVQREEARLSQSLAALNLKYEKLRIEGLRRIMADQQDTANRLWQGGGENLDDVLKKTVDLLTGDPKTSFKQSKYPDINSDNEGRSFVSLEPDEPDKTNLRRRLVRTIDIIPRQNALNVNDTKETVKATGIVAAFSFLFGFGGNIRYQRQSEQFEQFLNQELYTSGFGKGSTDFGWTFYPLAGTKQISPGVRTTYAVAIIPKDAETIVLKANGCYFNRKDYQPNDYNSTKTWNKDKKPKDTHCSEQDQAFIIPVPGGSGDRGSFYATEIRYSPSRKSGDKMIASIYGENFSPQMGVLINGVPLTQAIGLAQPTVESIISSKVSGICENGICGRFERISSSQIVISFNAPSGFKGTPRITLVAPGKAIELNRLSLNINGTEDTRLDDSDFMFGKPDTKASISVDDFNIASSTGLQMRGVITGDGFEKVDKFYVNGVERTCTPRNSSLCIVDFGATSSETVILTLSPKDNTESVVSKTFTNPFSFSLVHSSIISFEKGSDDKPPVMTVKLEGTGFSALTNIVLDEAATDSEAKVRKVTIPSSGLILLEIESPGPIVQVVLRNGPKSIGTLVARPDS
jgi:hypothetical protein